MFPLDLMTPPNPVDPLTPWGGLGVGLLLLLAAVGVAAAGILHTSTRSSAVALAYGGAGLLAIWPMLRLFRAVAPGERLWFWTLIVLFVAGAAAIHAAIRTAHGWERAAAVATWGAAALLAFGMDKWQEHMASIPMSWGVLLGGTAFFGMYIFLSDR